MKAAILKGLRDIVCEEVPEPTIGSGEVKVKVRYCGICGSDVHGYREGLFSPGTIMGHEFSGDVVELGPDADGVRLGQRVTVNPANLCGTCRWCRRGQFSSCPTAMAAGIGMSDWEGALAESVRVRASQILELPENVSYREGALMEPLAVAIHAVRSSGLCEGQSALVMGAGTVGLLVMQLARLAGAAEVFVAEPSKNRREAAMNLGCEHVYAPVAEQLREIKQIIAEGPDMVFECSGAESAMNDALRLVTRSGKIMLVGMSLKPVTLSHVHMLQKELTLQASLCYSDEFEYAVSLVSKGAVEVDALATHVVPLTEIKEAFERHVKEESSIKVLVEP